MTVPAGFRPWVKPTKRQKMFMGMPEWWKSLPPGCPDYDRMARAVSNLLMDQISLIRTQLKAVKAKEKGAEPLSKGQLDFLLAANREILGCRALLLKEKLELAKAEKAAPKSVNAFTDPRAADSLGGGDDSEFGADGRVPA